MAIGALITMAFFFAYTVVSTPTQDVGFSCAIAFCINIYYGTLYAVSTYHHWVIEHNIFPEKAISLDTQISPKHLALVLLRIADTNFQ